MQVIISQKAQDSLNDIVEYYRKKGYLKYGRKIRARIILKAMRLKDFPKMGQIEETLIELNMEHRYLVEENYKIIYRVVDGFVLVTNVFDTRQDPNKM